MASTGRCDIDFQRYGVMQGAAEQRVGFLLVDSFAMLPFVSALEPLRAANRFSQRHLYSWHLFGETARAVSANNGLSLAVEAGITDARNLDRLIVCGPHDPATTTAAETLHALKRLARAGTRMGGVDTGSFLLARARLMRTRRCTVHWENLPGFIDEFPLVNVTSELYEIDRDLFTCAGGDSALDMMMTLIAADHGPQLARQTAELFIHPAIREASAPQRMGLAQRSGIFHRGLVRALELMEAQLEPPLSPAALASEAGVSRRQLERLFRVYLNTTPMAHYQKVRLQAARALLEQTTLSVAEVAEACGFSSADHFARRFKGLFGQTPRGVRRS